MVADDIDMGVWRGRRISVRTCTSSGHQRNVGGDVGDELATFETPTTNHLTVYLSFPCLHGRSRTLMIWSNTRAFIETNTCASPVRDSGNYEEGKLRFCVMRG